MRHLIAQPGFDEFVLEDIKDTNEAALAVYAKVGFEVYKRRPQRFARLAGFRELVSMRLVPGG